VWTEISAQAIGNVACCTLWKRLDWLTLYGSNRMAGPSDFRVYDRERFKYQRDYASFVRQLNQYGFLRLKDKGLDQNAYYHEQFLRGRVDLAELIPRYSGVQRRDSQ
jgi:HSF-type DNA-binding